MSAGCVLVTGATGVVGRLAIPKLLERGYRVTAVGRTAAKRDELTALGAEAIALDMFDLDAARRAMAGHDAVINLATHMPASTLRMLLPWSWRENDRVRRDGSAVLVHAALHAGVSRFIQESFAPIYEDGGTQWIDEGWPQRPTPYNRTVLDAERSAAQFTAAGRTGVVLRFAGFYGPDALLGDLIAVVRRGWGPLPGRADAYWSAVSHEDAASALVAALEVPAGAYNVCDDEPLTRREWADVLADAAGAPRPKLLPPWMALLGGATMELLSRSQRMTNARLKAVSRWSPRWRSARDGVRAAVRTRLDAEPAAAASIGAGCAAGANDLY
jgi:2-alkyl-3-oxoalkanoate reductase